MGKNSLYKKGQRFYKSNSLIVYILSALLFCWITVIALNFNKNTIDVCDGLNQIQNVSSYATETTKLDSNILEYHNSRVNTGAFAVAIISTIITFLAFYIQYVFNKQQREDISKERYDREIWSICNDKDFIRMTRLLAEVMFIETSKEFFDSRNLKLVNSSIK